MDIDEINTHIHKLKCGSTDWQSVEKLAALCTVRDELEETHAPEKRRSRQCHQRLMRRRTPRQRNRKATLWRLPALCHLAV